MYLIFSVPDFISRFCEPDDQASRFLSVFCSDRFFVRFYLASGKVELRDKLEPFFVIGFRLVKENIREK